MTTNPDSQESCLWEEVLLSDDFAPDSSDPEEGPEGFEVVVEAPDAREEVDHA